MNKIEKEIEKLKEERKYFKKSGDTLSAIVAHVKIKALYLLLDKVEKEEE